MQRLTFLGFAGVLATFLAGCPIYGDTLGAGGACADGCCDPHGCQPQLECGGPSECGVNETCGDDDRCHSGDCTLWGCTAGFTCTVDATTKRASCEPGGDGSSGSGGSGGGGGAGGGAGGASSIVYCGNPGDCATGETCAPSGLCEAGGCTTLGCVFGYACSVGDVCNPTDPLACGADADCATLGAGFACVSGVCTAPENLCFDQKECGDGDKCAAGKCTAECASDTDCPASYACDPALGVCTKPVAPCATTNDCGGASLVCVDGACVPRSTGGTCAQGDVWVENGCVPNQSATFFCTTDGAIGTGQPNDCATTSICLHHTCFVACDADPTVCNAPENLCKTVKTSSGDHEVCGSTDNLGNACDPTDAAKACSGGKVCIDGFCK